MNQYYYHVQQLKQQQKEASPAVESLRPLSPSSAQPPQSPPQVKQTSVELVNRSNYIVPHQKADRVVTVKNKSIIGAANSKNIQKLQLHEAQQKSKLKADKRSNSKNQNQRTISVDNSLINTFGTASTELVASAMTTTAETEALSPLKKSNQQQQQQAIGSATQQISSLKLNRSVSSDNDLTHDSMRQPHSRVSAKIQQLLNTLKVNEL